MSRMRRTRLSETPPVGAITSRVVMLGVASLKQMMAQDGTSYVVITNPSGLSFPPLYQFDHLDAPRSSGR